MAAVAAVAAVSGRNDASGSDFGSGGPSSAAPRRAVAAGARNSDMDDDIRSDRAILQTSNAAPSNAAVAAIRDGRRPRQTQASIEKARCSPGVAAVSCRNGLDVTNILNTSQYQLQSASLLQAIGCGRQASIELFDARLCLAGRPAVPDRRQQQRSMVQRSTLKDRAIRRDICAMSLLRARLYRAGGAALDGPPDPKSLPDESSDPKLPPPPPLGHRAWSASIKFCSTTSVEYFSTPALVGPFARCNWPSI